MAIFGVGIKAHFGVKADEVAGAFFNDQRIDLAHLHVAFGEGGVELYTQIVALFFGCACQFKYSGDCVTICRRNTCGWVDHDC